MAGTGFYPRPSLAEHLRLEGEQRSRRASTPAPAARPSRQRCSSSSSRDHPCSVATFGRNTALRPCFFSNTPWRPGSICSAGARCSGRQHRHLHARRPPTPPRVRGQNRGSWNAASYATADTSCGSGPSCDTRPMHPRSRPCVRSVTNAPCRKACRCGGHVARQRQRLAVEELRDRGAGERQQRALVLVVECVRPVRAARRGPRARRHAASPARVAHGPVANHAFRVADGHVGRIGVADDPRLPRAELRWRPPSRRAPAPGRRRPS